MLRNIDWNLRNIGIVKCYLSDNKHHITTEYFLCVELTLSNVYTRSTNDEGVVFQSFLDVLPKHTNIITNKIFNVSDKFAARCAYLFPQEEKCTSSSWGNSKMHTSGSIANSQRLLTKTKVALKPSIWVESNIVKNLKPFIIVSSEMPISLFILCWWYFSDSFIW